jgi:putative ABC transport system permease protein
VGLSFALIVGAGLFVRTFATLATTPLGFDPSNLLIVRVDAAPEWVTPENKVAYAQRVAAAVAGAPGVARASFSRITPMSDGNTTSGVRLSGAPELPPGQGRVWMNFIESGWFETYGMRVQGGRDFASTDSAGSESVAVVNEAFARHFAAGRNVVGQQVASLTPGGLNARIVGVVNDSVYRTARLGVVPTLYQPMSQDDYHESSFSVTAKLISPRALAERDIADAIGRAAPDLAFRFRDYSDQLRATVIQERLVAMMSGFFGALAMLLAALGVYGVTAYSVGRRRVEIAVRMALGATAGAVVRLVLVRTATLVTAGAAIGVVLSLWASRFVGALLFGVDARDPFTLAVAAVVLVAVGLFAGWLPARNVSRLDPTTALRS